jgi:hypothetical protein
MPINSTKHVTLISTITKEAPDAKGVYALYSRDQELVYYGNTAVSIRQCLLGHLNGNEGKCMQNAWYFNFEVTEQHVTRSKELLEEFQQSFSTLPRCNEATYQMSDVG